MKDWKYITTLPLRPYIVVVEGDEWVVKGFTACPSLPFNKPGACYALLEIPEDPMAATGTLTATLKFKVDREKHTSGYRTLVIFLYRILVWCIMTPSINLQGFVKLII